MNDFTSQLLLIKHLYNETDIVESECINEDLKTNNQLSQLYDELLFVKNELNEISLLPNRKITNFIKEYSKIK